MRLFLLTFSCLMALTSFGQHTWKAPEESKQIKNPYEGNESAVMGGRQIFELLCTVCHGETGRGDGVTLEFLTPKPANLTSPEVQQQSAGEIYWKITTGNPPMQSYLNVLSGSEIWRLVTYIQSLPTED